jgi:hypothetical protein
MLRSSRELSNRVEIDVHSHPNRFRRATWWLALWAGVGALLWLSWQTVLGEHQIYQAGPVSLPHRLIENDCAMCHTTWAPLKRLLSFGDVTDDTRDGGHSIDSAKCETCHRVAAHHDNQEPAHHKVSCAACHQEHEGPELLARPSNRHCVACHADLKTTAGPTKTFASRVTRFDHASGHPEFACVLLAKNLADGGDEIGDTHGARRNLEHSQRPGELQARWQDRGRIRFNHAAHLKAEYDANGQLIFGLIGKDRKFTDLSRSCEVCHEPDHERHLMRPINYEQHCKACHPLLFDNDRYPGQSVPHESADVVRGFLTEVYTLRELSGVRGQGSGVKGQRSEVRGQRSEVREEPSSDSRSRPIPGHRNLQRLTKKQAKTVLDDVTKAETLAQQHRHSLFGYEASGGCRYCHQVELVAAKGPTSLADWMIVPPKIPDRWLLHAEFHHEPHRLLSCTTCHADVGSSRSTGDVLIPSIAVCRACHSEEPARWSDRLPAAKPDSTKPPARADDRSLKELLSTSTNGARFDCVECHRYHDQAKEKLNGRFSEK